jgi:adenylate kinase
MRVIVIGTTGVNMRALATSLDAFHKRQGRGRLGIYFVEDELRKEVDWVNFLDSDDYFWQERVWREAAAKAIGRAEEEAPEYALLFMNLPYFRKSRFFPAVDIAILRAFRPDMLLTLIEEAHVIWRRIQIREEREKTGARLRLKDVFAWRTASILLGDTIAKAIGVPNVVIAVKHPPKTIYGIALQGAKPRFYLSFPITLVRDEHESRREIDNFRRVMHERFYAFDPLTMDERVLRTAKRRGEVKVVEAGSRWLLPEDVKPAVEDEPELYPMEIPADQVEEVLADIDNLIKFKDFRFILQSDAVAVYRPFMKKLFHRGVFSEIMYATNTAHKRLFIYWPPEDKVPGMDSPFDPGVGTVEEDLEKFFQQLEKFTSRFSALQ